MGLCYQPPFLALFSSLALLASSFIAPESLADDQSDRMLASQCAQCHGTDGHAVGDMDGLAGSELDDLFDKLLDIKDKDDHDIMHFQIQGYTEDQLYGIALYYSGIPEEDESDD